MRKKKAAKAIKKPENEHTDTLPRLIGWCAQWPGSQCQRAVHGVSHLPDAYAYHYWQQLVVRQATRGRATVTEPHTRVDF